VIEQSIPAMLRQCVNLQPDGTAFTFIDYEQDWAGVAETLTWLQLYRRVLNVAQELRLCASAGDRALILAPQGVDYIVAFLGALQAGLIAVPLLVPLGGASDQRVDSVLHDASPTIILTTSSVMGNVVQHVTPQSGESAASIIRCVAGDRILRHCVRSPQSGSVADVSAALLHLGCESATGPSRYAD
jgi:acyl-CoA synthetase (AMP-forming)/AMP-acid ligase II